MLKNAVVVFIKAVQLITFLISAPNIHNNNVINKKQPLQKKKSHYSLQTYFFDFFKCQHK